MATFSGKGRASSSSLLAPSHSTLCRAPVPKRLSLVPLDPGQVQLFPLLVPRSFLETAQSGPASPGMPANSPILQFVAWGALSQALRDQRLRQGSRAERHSQ